MREFRADLHVHTDASPDGRSGLAGLAEAARARGLDAIAVSDHNLCTPVPERLSGVLLIPACEVSTKAGHITGLFLSRPLELDKLGRLPPPEAAVAAIREAGGLAVLAHPFQRPGRRPEELAFGVDGVETANARADLKVPDANARADRLAAARGLPRVGGSDAHDAAEVGSAYTLLSAQACTLSDLRAALASGRSRAVLVQNTSHLRKGLSQWTKARRLGGVFPTLRAAAYLCWCGVQDVFCSFLERKEPKEL